METYYFTEMPFTAFPESEAEKYPAMRLTFPNSYFDPNKAHDLFKRYLDEFQFAEEIDKCLFTHKGRKIDLDTTGKTPAESLDELLLLSEPLVTAGEVAMRAIPVPDGNYEVVYENGVRKTKPVS